MDLSDRSFRNAMSKHSKQMVTNAFTEQIKRNKNKSMRVYFTPKGKKYYSRIATVRPPYDEPGNARYTLDYCKVRNKGRCRWTKEKKYDTLNNLIKKLNKMGDLKKIELI